MVTESIDERKAEYPFPCVYWCRIHTNSHVEKAVGEVRRRTRVGGFSGWQFRFEAVSCSIAQSSGHTTGDTRKSEYEEIAIGGESRGRSGMLNWPPHLKVRNALDAKAIIAHQQAFFRTDKLLSTTLSSHD